MTTDPTTSNSSDNGAPFRTRFSRVVAANRWSLIASCLLLALIVAVGAVIGLAPAIVAALAVGVLIVAIGAMALRRRRHNGDHHFGVGTVFAHFSLVLVAAFVAIQFVPYGRDHTNPPITGEPSWSSPRTRELMVNACFGCHSNEVQWPWYSNIAPISWAVVDHVQEGREEINYSEFTTNADEADDTTEVILDGSMPPGYYTIFGLHPEANLTDAEVAELVAGLQATPGLTEGGQAEGGESDDDDD